MPNRKIQPAIVDAIDFDLQLKPCALFTLDNGVQVYAVDAGETDVLQIEWVFYAGNFYEHKNIVAGTTNFMLKNGTHSKNAFAINEHFEYYGAYLNRACYNETATITLHCLNKHLPVLLPAVAELITDSIFPEEELAIYKQNQQQKLTVKLKKADFIASRTIDTLLYGIQHPYGIYTSHDDYKALERDELVAFYQQFYTKGKCVLFVGGKLPANLEQQLNTSFGNLPLNSTALPALNPLAIPATEKKHHLINDENGVQSSIRIARPFPNRHHPDFIKVQVLNTIFGGFFGSRLMSNIREDKGYTYGIHSFIQNHIQQTSWMVSTEAGRVVCDATIKEVYFEMERLRNEPVPQEELELVRNFMIGSILGDLDGPFQIIGRWKNYVLNNLTDAYFYKSIDTIKHITATEIQDLAIKYLQPDAFYELTVI